MTTANSLGMSQPIKSILLLFIGVVIGYSAHVYLNPAPKASNEVEHSENIDLQKVRQQLQTISDSDLMEYLSLKDQKEKYLKANDILGKIMVIFLADLSLRIKSSDVDKLFELSESIVEKDDEDFNVKENPTKVSSKKETKEQASPAPATIIEGSQVDWKKAEEKLSEVRSESDIEDFLKKVEIKDFFNQIASARNIRRPSLRKINGIFTGLLKRDDPSRGDADVYMKLDSTIEDRKLKGNNEIVLSRNGVVFSNTTGDGTISNYKNIKGSKEAIFVDLGGKSGFVQLYFMNDGTSAFGLYYYEASIGNFVKSGSIRLQKH